ncbi:unnamed protein product [Didymodactylos carnosus]|uniref:NAD(P)(+)--arginine ADP-ribosyltransferase n=1 Tax=Didymodactylos carnosus TaxID=1234261 RepID=A0A814Y1Y9_9BILA|nr:unnamed protein product [Didymodactylos carnosus]CAF1223136.1 unnamed protein product [Didymodactylos carnosus]CAF3844082.1 unnamed protein product [Didymodactylos carnosus]CAF3986389.1 unnamed protein product [Didymodactylos carnosus]
MFKSEKEVMKYITNRETMVMWLRFFDWFSHKFSRFIDRTEALNEDESERESDYKASVFDIDVDRDLDEFLKKADPDNYNENKQAIKEVKTSESVRPLIRLYTQEIEFYKILNEQLALTITSDYTKKDPNGTLALCDRFVQEFDIRQDELSKIAYTKISYRGVTMKEEDLQKYKDICQNNKYGVIATKTFSASSKSREVALSFIDQNCNGKGILFVFEVPHVCSTICAAYLYSDYSNEKEVLILSGNLFRVEEVIDNKDDNVTGIQVEHLMLTISFFQKA